MCSTHQSTLEVFFLIIFNENVLFLHVLIQYGGGTAVCTTVFDCLIITFIKERVYDIDILQP